MKEQCPSCKEYLPEFDLCKLETREGEIKVCLPCWKSIPKCKKCKRALESDEEEVCSDCLNNDSDVNIKKEEVQ